MAPRKRKSPEGAETPELLNPRSGQSRSGSQQTGNRRTDSRMSDTRMPERRGRPFVVVLLSSTALFLGHAARWLGGLAWRHPRPVLTTTLFAGAFGAIAANALWYQPHHLQSPYLATRDISHFSALPGLRKVQKPADNVTTFKIERQDDETAAADGTAEPIAAGTDAQAGLKVASLPPAAPSETGVHAVAQPENVALAVAVQQALIRKGLYDGVPDGVIGPRTSAAILLYEQTAGLPQTGEVSENLLQALMADGGAGPSAAPSLTKASAAPETDPVAAAIRGEGAAAHSAAARPTAPPARAADATQGAPVVKVSGKSDDLASLIRQDQPDATAGAGAKQTAAASPAAAAPAGPALIKQIQKGLIRMEYPDVDPDGVAGNQTRAAIRQFEKYYGLPVTGEPSAKILAKMQEIGAV